MRGVQDGKELKAPGRRSIAISMQVKRVCKQNTKRQNLGDLRLCRQRGKIVRAVKKFTSISAFFITRLKWPTKAQG